MGNSRSRTSFFDIKILKSQRVPTAAGSTSLPAQVSQPSFTGEMAATTSEPRSAARPVPCCVCLYSPVHESARCLGRAGQVRKFQCPVQNPKDTISPCMDVQGARTGRTGGRHLKGGLSAGVDAVSDAGGRDSSRLSSAFLVSGILHVQSEKPRLQHEPEVWRKRSCRCRVQGAETDMNTFRSGNPTSHCPV